jgi:hypothetical protein
MFNIISEVEFLIFCPKANLNLFNNQNLVMESVIYLKSQNLEKLVVKFFLIFFSTLISIRKYMFFNHYHIYHHS